MRGGFTDPVRHSQAVFRAVMDALARPGTLTKVTGDAAPPPLTEAAGALALTLVDQDTAVWLDKPLKAEPAVAAWLAFQTGARTVDYAGDADFAFVADAPHLPPLEGFAQGSQEYPDRSTTLIVQVPGLTRGPRLRLTGPGIETEAEIRPKGLSEHFPAQWAANRARFPRGVDMVLVGPEGLIGLPRTVAIEMKEA
jgi:alpha-D-ribose 1-methylphosphonate 5-triphosphate synthase subunit PhnH